MRGTRLINVVVSTFICLWLIISAVFIMALLQNSNKSQIIELKGWHKSYNEPFKLINLLPGDSETRNFVVKVYHWKSTVLYFQMDETKNSGSVNLSEKLLVDVVLTKSGAILFSGTMAELIQHAVALDLPKNNQGYTTTEYAVRVYLPKEVGNDYQFTSFHGDFKWWVNEGAAFAPLIYILLIIIILIIFTATFLIWLSAYKKQYHLECGNCMFDTIINLFFILLLISLLIVTLYLFLRASVVVPGNIFKTSGVIIELNNCEKLFDDSYIAPGESIKREVIIKNLGASSVYYRLYLKNVRGSLKKDLIFNFYFQDTLIKSVHPVDFTINNSLSSDVQLDVGSNVSYTLEVLLPEQIGNVAQDEFLDFDIVLDAIQAKNNPR